MQPLPLVETLVVAVDEELVAEPLTLAVDPEVDVSETVPLVVAIAPPIDIEAVVEVAPAPPPPWPFPYGLSDLSAQPPACMSARAAMMGRQTLERWQERFMSSDLPFC